MSALRTLLGTSVGALIVIAIGCGGSTGSDTGIDGGGSSGSGGGSGSGSSSGGGSSSGAGDDASGPVDDSGSPAADDATAPDTDAAPGGGMTMPPRGTDGGAGQIACGMAPCNSATQVCCRMNRTDTCTTAAACTGTALACTGTNSCTAGICCGTFGRRGTPGASKCAATCTMGEVQLCTTNADCAGGEICSRLTATCEPGPMGRDGGGRPMFDGGHFPFGDGGH